MHEDLHRYLVQRGAVDERMPECPDVEAKWAAIAEAYLPDGAREFADYPIASLGWMMFIGMAVAKYWDTDWERYANVEDLYTPMRDKRGFDSIDHMVTWSAQCHLVLMAVAFIAGIVSCCQAFGGAKDILILLGFLVSFACSFFLLRNYQGIPTHSMKAPE